MYAQSLSSYLEVNGGVGLETESRFSFGAMLIGGFNITDKFFVGAIAGYEYFDALYMVTKQRYNGRFEYNYNHQPKNLLKVGLRAKRKFSANETSPFVSFDFGLAKQIAYTNYYCADGIFIKPAIGMDVNLGGTMMYISVAYKAQNNTHGDFDFYEGSSEEIERKAELIDVSVGFLF